jgi:hypothetical protein
VSNTKDHLAWRGGGAAGQSGGVLGLLGTASLRLHQFDSTRAAKVSIWDLNTLCSKHFARPHDDHPISSTHSP